MPRTRAVVVDSATWPAVWHAAADTVPLPPVAFGDDGLMLVATRGYSMGTSTLDGKWIRRCRRTGVVVVATLENPPHVAGTAVLSRGMSLVRAPRRALEGARVVFLRSAVQVTPLLLAPFLAGCKR